MISKYRANGKAFLKKERSLYPYKKLGPPEEDCRIPRQAAITV